MKSLLTLAENNTPTHLFPNQTNHSDPRVDAIIAGIDFDVITPSDQAELIRLSRMRGIDITTSLALRQSIDRFIADFEKRIGADAGNRAQSNTVRSLLSNWKLFARWCNENNVAGPLPAPMATVEQYLMYRFEKGLSKHSLVMDQWAIRRFHLEGGCPDPTSEERIKGLVAKLKRDRVFIHNDLTKQATAMRKSTLKRLVELWGGPESTLKQKRDLAMMVIAYCTLLRGSELARIKLEHFSVKSDGRGAVLMIPVSKTNHSGSPDAVFLKDRQMQHVYRYLAADGRSINDSGYLLGSVTANGRKPIRRVDPLTVQTVRDTFRRAWDATAQPGSNERPFSAHSARVGAAQDLRLKDGVKIQDIMHAGRWSNESMVLRYTRNVDAEETSAVMIQDDF
ncbi:tyrosine-type recombinase/integrase (plasmid) [Aeromonas hydrophila]|uniref:tyrosine-type recombinase/integrase n=1 Tax=Aeromonas hydrophila TaxID=644 RepID=UPI002ED60C44|nr:tyrosine-type recombinase/integrase [Aeromonas hydrophila]